MADIIRVCPRCGSARIVKAELTVNGWIIPTTYHCEAEGCEYSGSVSVEIDATEIEHFQSVLKPQSRLE